MRTAHRRTASTACSGEPPGLDGQNPELSGSSGGLGFDHPYDGQYSCRGSSMSVTWSAASARLPGVLLRGWAARSCAPSSATVRCARLAGPDPHLSGPASHQEQQKTPLPDPGRGAFSYRMAKPLRVKIVVPNWPIRSNSHSRNPFESAVGMTVMARSPFPTTPTVGATAATPNRHPPNAGHQLQVSPLSAPREPGSSLAFSGIRNAYYLLNQYFWQFLAIHCQSGWEVPGRSSSVTIFS